MIVNEEGIEDLALSEIYTIKRFKKENFEIGCLLLPKHFINKRVKLGFVRYKCRHCEKKFDILTIKSKYNPLCSLKCKKELTYHMNYGKRRDKILKERRERQIRIGNSHFMVDKDLKKGLVKYSKRIRKEILEECIKNPKKYLKAEVNNGV